MSGIDFIALGGSDTIGGSKLLLRHSGGTVMLDFGLNYHAIDEYYEEFLQPRAGCGILDYITMGVLPNVRGLYRDDLCHPDLRLDGPDVGKIDAVVLSHAHMDHCGDIGFLPSSVPVATSLMSAALMKAIQDSSKGALGRDMVYGQPRELSDSEREAKIISTKGDELQQRDFCIAEGGWKKGFEDFWSTLPSEKVPKSKSRKVLAYGELLKEPPFKLIAHPVDHSIKGANGFIMPTENGKVVYTGDIRLHGLEGEKTRRFADAARGSHPFALIIEGTTIGRESHVQMSEKDVKEESDNLMAGMTGAFAVADFGPRNFERLDIFLDLAKKYHRKLVVTPKDAYLLTAMNTVDESIPVPGKNEILIYDCPRGKYDYWERWILNILYEEHTVAPAEIKGSPGDYLLSFSYWDMNNLVDLKPEKGHYIYSSSEAYGEEQKQDFVRLSNWLKKFEIKPYGFALMKNAQGKLEPDFTQRLHASGHASPEDLKNIIREIDPEILIPVHTEHREWFVKEFGSEMRVILPEMGKPFSL